MNRENLLVIWFCIKDEIADNWNGLKNLVGHEKYFIAWIEIILFSISFNWAMIHKRLAIWFFSYISVCCSSKRPAVTCINLVWRFTGLSSAQYGPPVSWSVSYRTPLSILFNLLHCLSVGKLFTKVTKTFHQVYLLLIILFHILM